MAKLNSQLQLPEQKVYTPFVNGYKVAPGLQKLGTEKVFDIDTNYYDYIELKKNTQLLRHQEHYSTIIAVQRFVINTLILEQSEFFVRTHGGAICTLTNKELQYDYYTSSIGSCIQEDLAVIQYENGKNWASVIYAAQPAGWVPEEKIGKSFAEIHGPVPHMETMNQKQDDYIQLMINSDGLVRFVWSVSESGVYVERQCIIGLPKHSAALFTIRPYFYKFGVFSIDELQHLISSVNSMSEDSLKYKAINKDLVIGKINDEIQKGRNASPNSTNRTKGTVEL